MDIYRLTPGTNSYLQLCLALKNFDIDIVLDVGANEGQFASQIRNFGFEKKIVCFEPLSEAHHKLTKSMKKDPLCQVHQRCAVGDHIGEIEINISRNSVSSSILPMANLHSLAQQESVYMRSENVSILTLDSITQDYLQDMNNPFLKIDTQGFEWQVLDGASRTLPKLKGIMCEVSFVTLYQGQHLWEEVLHRISSEGFTLWSIQGGFTDPRDGRTLQVDCIFFRL